MIVLTNIHIFIGIGPAVKIWKTFCVLVSLKNMQVLDLFFHSWVKLLAGLFSSISVVVEVNGFQTVNAFAGQ